MSGARSLEEHHDEKEYDFARLAKAEPKYLKRVKTAVTMRLDPTVIAYFRSLSNINSVLREYASRALVPSANWPAGKIDPR